MTLAEDEKLQFFFFRTKANKVKLLCQYQVAKGIDTNIWFHKECPPNPLINHKGVLSCYFIKAPPWHLELLISPDDCDPELDDKTFVENERLTRSMVSF